MSPGFTTLSGFRGAFFGFKGPNLELLLIELVYFIIIATICLVIYLKVNDVYKLYPQRGVFYFKNIFLFFSISYFFRFINIALVLSNETFSLELPRLAFMASFFFVGFFSTMAILSIAMSAMIKSVKISISNKVPYVLYLIALVLSIFVGLARSDFLLIVLQTLLLAGAILIVFLAPVKKSNKKLLSQNRVTYLLLAIFWIVNLLVFTKRLFPIQIKIVLYALSIAVFLSIFLRVQKRLPSNAKKKR